MGIIGITGSALAFSSASGGKVYAYNAIGTAASVVAPANSSRVTITFHNPGTVTLYIAPVVAFASETASSPTTLSPTTGALGGCFMLVGGGTLILTGECTGSWQALSATGTANPLTVMDSNT